MSDPHDLAAVDEILQVMYWLEGEKLATAADASTVARFVALDERRIEALLVRLAAMGFVRGEPHAPADPISGGEVEPRRYVFTAAGRAEAARRFTDEFAGMMNRGHGECNDPGCECQRTGSPEDCRHRSREGSRT
jgi:hypothetical protein